MNSEGCLYTPLAVNVSKCICSNTLPNNNERALSVEEKLNNISFDMLPLSTFHFCKGLQMPEFLRTSLKQNEKIYISKQSNKMRFSRFCLKFWNDFIDNLNLHIVFQVLSFNVLKCLMTCHVVSHCSIYKRKWYSSLVRTPLKLAVNYSFQTKTSARWRFKVQLVLTH